MISWKEFIRILMRDRYSVGRNAHIVFFVWKKSLVVKTQFGFKFRFRVSCFVDKVDHEEFREADMLEVANQQRFVDDWITSVFFPKLREWGFSFKLVFDSRNGWSNSIADNPYLCCPRQENNHAFVYFDHNYVNFLAALEKVPFRKSGCKVRTSALHVEPDYFLMKENYDMIKLRAVGSVENTAQYREYEEHLVASLLHRQLEMEQEFQKLQATQEHTSKIIQLKAQQVGSAVHLSWKIDGYQNSGYILRGFRSEGGPEYDYSPGKCVIETYSNGSAVHSLPEGRECFYTFSLIKADAAYTDFTFQHSLHSRGGSTTKSDENPCIDSLRFSVRIPTQAEMRRIERLTQEVLSRPAAIDPKKERLEQARKDLFSFIEFEETFSELEKELTRQIESKEYSREEREDRIERLKGVIEILRVKSYPSPET